MNSDCEYQTPPLPPPHPDPHTLSSADIFQDYSFQEILSETLLEYQTVWIQIRSDVLLSLIWVQTVCKDKMCRQQSEIIRTHIKENWMGRLIIDLVVHKFSH